MRDEKKLYIQKKTNCMQFYSYCLFPDGSASVNLSLHVRTSCIS